MVGWFIWKDDKPNKVGPLQLVATNGVITPKK